MPHTVGIMTAQLPQYQFIAESLLRRIANGSYQLGERLPSETQLAEDHGVARETIRRALDRLQQLGMIERRPGDGTRIVSLAPVGSYPTFATSAGDIASLAAETRLLRPKSGEISIDRQTARRIGTRAGTKWFALEGARVRRAGPKEPICWSEHYLRADQPREKFLGAPLQLQDVTATRIEQRVAASPMPERFAEALAAAPGSAALVVIRRHFDQRGRVISAGIHTHPGGRYEIVTSVQPTE